MTTALFDGVARIARHEAAARPVAAIGRVTQLYESAGGRRDYAVAVELRDSGLVIPRVPLATGFAGWAALPDIDDLVLVVFAAGDYHAPVVVGRLYAAEQEPPEHAAGQAVLQLPAGSDRASAALGLIVERDEPRIELKLGEDIAVIVDAEQLDATVGDMRLRLTTAGGGSTTVQAGDASVTLKSGGDILLKCSSALKIEASDIEIKASGSVAIKGAKVDIN